MSYLMKKDGDKILRGKSLGLEKLHRSIVGTDVEGRLDKSYIIIYINIYIYTFYCRSTSGLT